MTDKEIIQALRLCSCETSTRNCPTCPLSGNDDCVTDALREAADIIERLTAENVVLPDGQASAIDFICPTDFWEAWGEEITHWLPLPEAPEGGDKA
jgi:hypothetical protein